MTTDNRNNSFSFSVSNNLHVSYGMPLWIPSCDICYRRDTVDDDADVQKVGSHSLGIDPDTGEEVFEDEWLCKQHRIEFNKLALTSYKKEDIGKRKTYVEPTTLREID